MNFKYISQWKVCNITIYISEFRFRVIKTAFELWFESYLENIGVWYKSIESNTESSKLMNKNCRFSTVCLICMHCCYVNLLVLPTLFIWICRWHGKESCFVPLTRLTGWVMALKSLQTITDCPHRKVKSFLLTNVN